MHVTPSGHRFSAMDARRTIADALEFVDDVAPHHRTAVVERRRRLVELLGTVVPAGDRIDPETLSDGSVTGVIDLVWELIVGVRQDLAGLLPAAAGGSVVGLFAGSGGVPKHGVDRVEVDLGGVVGDRQATRRHHGAPFQALCLWSSEVIASLAADGHPIGPGSAGENVTIAGLEWALVTPVLRLAIGSVVADVSSYAVPCRQNAPWFSDRRFDRIHHRHGPISRMYATVVEPGSIVVGDTVVLEPA